MGKTIEEDRRCAAALRARGERPAAIAAALGRARSWVYKWLNRASADDATWNVSHSRAPHRRPRETTDAITEIISATRHRLRADGVFHGAQAIHWELQELSLPGIPSVRTIGRVLQRLDLVERRHGRYTARGTRYPGLIASTPGAVHQSDFVGPCYGQRPLRFYSLHSVDLATGRCAVEPVTERAAQATIDAFWASWWRLGLPQAQQVDNEAVFYGSVRYPRGMGALIRLCLSVDVEPWFIPPGEPWRNGVVEKFNDHWRAKGPLREALGDAAVLRAASRMFEERHNTRYRYTKLQGRTPARALAAWQGRLRFPPTADAPRHPLPKPITGRYHVVRFIRSDRVLDIFGERVPVPDQAMYEYVRGTVDVAHQRLRLYLDGELIDEHPFRLR